MEKFHARFHFFISINYYDIFEINLKKKVQIKFKVAFSSVLILARELFRTESSNLNFNFLLMIFNAFNITKPYSRGLGVQIIEYNFLLMFHKDLGYILYATYK